MNAADGYPEREWSGAQASARLFSYEEAFSRNLGWLTEWEQQALRGKCIGIAGMGGVGGAHLLTLARSGIGRFHIADYDHFELANFNRQTGASTETLGRPKVEVLAERAREINPELHLAIFDAGIDEHNLESFLAGVDVYVDGLDFFALEIRRKLMARCAELGIPTIIAAPVGMGAAYVVFEPGGMSFEHWFRLEGLSDEHQYVNFLLGLAPSGLHRSYLVDPSRVDLANHRVPSTGAACELCAGVASVEAVKLLLRRGRVRAVPYYHQFDAYRGRWAVKKLPGGNRNPLQRVKIAVTRRLAKMLSSRAIAREINEPGATEIERILDLARWAPSTDNCQPWRFELMDDDTVIVTLTVQSDHDVYDYRGGELTLLSGGMLLESMRIAASLHGRDCHWSVEQRRGRDHRIRVSMPKTARIAVDPLISYIPLRSVDRRPYRLRPLTEQQREALTNSHGPELQFEWHSSVRQRWRLARLAGKAAAARLTTPEAFAIHQRVLKWDRQSSSDGIPAAAAGLSRWLLGLTRWAMRDWRRMRLLNGIGGAFVGAVQMDYLPAAFSAAFFTIRIKPENGTTEGRVVDLLRAGQTIQRFWLTATQLGLSIQPSMATPVFAHYGKHAPDFTANARARKRAIAVAQAFAECGLDDAVIFMGRIGVPRGPGRFIRSVRRPLRDLLMAALGVEQKKIPAE